jgi:hypothetical protein
MYKEGMIAALIYTLAGACHAETFVSDDVITNPVPERFSLCHGYTCDYVTQTSLTSEQWQRIRNIFAEKYHSAQVERRLIGKAVAELEKMTGELIGTSLDMPKNHDGMRMDLATQMDCIDESTNTTIYLMMIEHDGLMKYHKVEDRQTRGYFIFGMPHTTAVISEKRTGKQYAVDSWFEGNGKPPHVLPVDVWADGWDPTENRK